MIKKWNNFNESNENESFTSGFERKLKERFNSDDINYIINLIPDDIILPLYYKGDIVWNKDIEAKVRIIDIDRKNGKFIYYFNHNDDILYSYEESFK